MQRHLSDPDWPRQRRPPDWVRLPREVTEAIARGEDLSGGAVGTEEAIGA
jgi:hypothetical protein